MIRVETGRCYFSLFLSQFKLGPLPTAILAYVHWVLKMWGPKRAWAEDPLKIKVDHLGCSILARPQLQLTHRPYLPENLPDLPPPLQIQPSSFIPSSAAQHP